LLFTGVSHDRQRTRVGHRRNWHRIAHSITARRGNARPSRASEGREARGAMASSSPGEPKAGCSECLLAPKQAHRERVSQLGRLAGEARWAVGVLAADHLGDETGSRALVNGTAVGLAVGCSTYRSAADRARAAILGTVTGHVEPVSVLGVDAVLAGAGLGRGTALVLAYDSPAIDGDAGASPVIFIVVGGGLRLAGGRREQENRGREGERAGDCSSGRNRGGTHGTTVPRARLPSRRLPETLPG